MTQLAALKKLATKIEAGEHGNQIAAFRDLWVKSTEAYSGSLDAAKALHEAVLPGWDWSLLNCVQGDIAGVGPAREEHKATHKGYDVEGNTARAWLLAIIRAKIAELEVET